MELNPLQLDEIIERALQEDIGPGDLTSRLLFSEDAPAKAVIVAKQRGIVAGLPVAERTLRRLDPDVVWKVCTEEAQPVRPGQTVVELEGGLRAILAGERVALNFLQRLGGIATLTREFVEAVQGFPAKILDTRKTAPGLRMLDKYAVRRGGGVNHRFGLYDGILLKDNHLRAAGGVGGAIQRIWRNLPPTVKIEVEVSNLAEVEEALRMRADIVLLDNMPLAEIQKAVQLVNRRAKIEVSGGVTLENVREIAATGVDFISVGALTHSVKALDCSLELV